MAPASPAKGGKKRGPGGLSPIAWAGVAGGVLVVFYLYKKRAAAAAASSSSPSTSLLGGTSIPGGSDASSPTAVPTTWGAWEEAAISALASGPNYSATQALNDLQSWVQGGCVSAAGYTGIGQVITTLGLPPGFGTGLPSLVACPTTTATGGGGTTTTTTTTAAAPAPTPAPSFHPLSGLQSVLDLLGAGGTAYQSGAEAIAWDAAHGGNATGIDPNQYYALSAPAAQALAKSGQTVYQSDADVQLWNTLHPNG